jgi:betaine-aldehyde dehydrogenase
MTDYDKLLIGGTWAEPSSGQRIEVRSPATLDVVGTVPEALEADVDAAVAAARQAFDRGPWPTTPPEERARVIATFTELLAARLDEVSGIITGEMGAPPATVQMMMWTPASAVLDFYGKLATTFPWEETRTGMFGETKVRREPVGVVAAIIPTTPMGCLETSDMPPSMPGRASSTGALVMRSL